MNDDKPFITDKVDMLATMIICIVLLLIGVVFAGWVVYELWHFLRVLFA